MKKINFVFIFISLISLFTIVFGSIVLAKYIKTNTNNMGVSSDKFYFTINILGDTNELSSLEKEYHLYGGDSKEINFVVQNYFDELRYTVDNILYTVEIVEGSDIANIDVEANNELVGGSCKSKECKLNINEGYMDKDVVKVKVSSTKPYTKTMYLTFVLHNYTSDIIVGLNDSVGSLYFEVIVDVNIFIDAKHIIIDYSDINSTIDQLQVDLTNNYLLDEGNELITNKLSDGESYLKKVTITKELNAGEAISLNYFKTDPSKNYKNSIVSIIKEIDGSNITYVIKIEQEGGMSNEN